MSVTTQVEPMVSEPLSWAEIKERYPDQWVCLVEIERIEEHNFAFQTARVVGYGDDPSEPLEQARPLRARYPSIGHYFTGQLRAPVPRFLVGVR